MRRFWIVTTLACFMLTGLQVSVSANPEDQRGEYQKQSESKLKEFKQRADELKTKAEELRRDVKREFDREMKEFEEKRVVANKKLE